ncbi:RNA polymerase sigma factor [Paenibacillus septentrionalis]|uniref:RNA polymerase sigma factor n=1 Tax=Paenibacillus septentrionalis TaxID=429342 RepID=A0ABW1UYE0_9BACL
MNVVRLVKQAKKGNKESLLELIMTEKDAYYRLAYTYMGNPHDAMDALEEMIVILYEKIDQLKSEKAFYSWSKTVLVNTCKGMLKQRNRLVFQDDLLLEGQDVKLAAASYDPYKKSDQQMDMDQMLLSLNEHQKEAIQLKYWHDLDYETIASITNTSVGTVKSRVFQGLKKLKERYGGGQFG